MKTIKHIPRSYYDGVKMCSCNNGYLEFIQVRTIFSSKIGVCVFCPACYRAGGVGKGTIMAEAIDEAIKLWNEKMEELDCMYAIDGWYVSRGYFN